MKESKKVVGGEDSKKENELYEFDNELLFKVDTDNFGKRKVTFVCPTHRVPLVKDTDPDLYYPNEYGLSCPICERDEGYEPLIRPDCKFDILERKALALLDGPRLKNAKLIRIDDVYTPELKSKDLLENKEEKYFLKTEVKTDKDGDTIVVLYIGYKGEKEKTQFFIKPEKLQLSTDYKDMDPAKILSKIELTLKNRTITQKYEQ